MEHSDRASRRSRLSQKFGGRRYVDAGVLTTVALVLLLLSVGATAWSYTVLREKVRFLTEVAEGRFETDADVHREQIALEEREFPVVMARALINLLCAIVVLKWIHRATSNVHALGAKDLTFSPAAAVGWYFCPVANFFLPYQSMTETWRASQDPSGWRRLRVPWILPAWWLLWIAATGLSVTASIVVRDESDIDQLQSGIFYEQWSEITWALAACFLIAILIGVLRAQRQSHAGREVAVEHLAKVFE